MFIRKATSVGAVNIADRAAAIGLGIFLARILAPDGYGAYAFVMSQVTIVALLAKLGLPELILRDFAASRGNQQAKVPVQLLRIAVMLASSASLILIAVGVVLIWLFYDGPNVQLYLLGLMMIAPMALFEIYAGALRGLGYVVTFQLLTTLCLTLLVLLVSIGYFLGFGEFSAFDALAIRASILLLLLATSVAMVTRAISRRSDPIDESRPGRQSAPATLKTSLSFLVIGVLHVVFVTIDQLMLGYMVGERAVAIFKVAAEGAQIVAFAYIAGNAVLAPEYSRIFSSQDMGLLENTARQSAAIVLVIAVPLFLVISIFAKPIVTLAFGDAYATSAMPLSILALGHFLALLFGDPLYILNMTGHHKTSMRLTIIAVATNMGLNAMAIPQFGVTGAAAATTFSFILLRFMAYFHVRSLLGIECSAISGLNQVRKMGMRRG